MESFVDNEKQDKRSQRAEEGSAIKKKIIFSRHLNLRKIFNSTITALYYRWRQTLFTTDKWVNLIIPLPKEERLLHSREKHKTRHKNLLHPVLLSRLNVQMGFSLSQHSTVFFVLLQVTTKGLWDFSEKTATEFFISGKNSICLQYFLNFLKNIFKYWGEKKKTNELFQNSTFFPNTLHLSHLLYTSYSFLNVDFVVL